MSAKNWSVCPRCRAAKIAEKVELATKARAAYGKIGEMSYRQMVAESEQPIDHKETLREDYDIGVWGGKFIVSYQCCCEDCGFKHHFSHEEATKVIDDGAGQ